MATVYHILNGDALLARFPIEIAGEKRVARECVVDGPTDAPDWDSFFALRATYLSQTYGGISREDYYRLTPPELMAMGQIPAGAEVNLWFEEDLFCVANLWMVCRILWQTGQNYSLYWVRPAAESPYSFGSSKESELVQLHAQRMQLSAECFARLGQCWPHFQKGDVRGMKNQINQLPPSYQFLQPAIQAWEDMIPRPDGWRGKPMETLASWLAEDPTLSFEQVFARFCQILGVYGLGDLQVKRMWEQLGKRNP